MQKRYNPAAEIINAITALSDDPEILVKFKGRDYQAKFYGCMIDLLTDDPAVEWIIDAETGELLYMA